MSKDNTFSSSPTVQFDVGGTVYKVSRSLLELFPNTMLSRMVSETWQEVVKNGDENNEASPIFIDRNGDRFQYVLDYMRDNRQVSLPVTVSRDGFLKDLDYYGFEEVDTNSIAERSSLAVYRNTLLRMEKLEQDIDARIKSDYDTARLAHYCFLRFKYTGKLEFCVHCGYHEAGLFSAPRHQKYNDPKVMEELGKVARSTVPKLAYFNKFLGEYGLKCTDGYATSMTCNPTKVVLAIIDGM